MTLYESLFKVYMVSFWTEPFLIFWIFMKKTFVKVCINYFDEQEKPWIYLNIFQKKKKIPKPLEPFYAIQNLELSSLANHGDRHFFKTLPPPPPHLPPAHSLLLLRPWFISWKYRSTNKWISLYSSSLKEIAMIVNDYNQEILN